jgi:hypothetical protein
MAETTTASLRAALDAGDVGSIIEGLEALVTFTGGLGRKATREEALRAEGSTLEDRVSTVLSLGAPALVVSSIRTHALSRDVPTSRDVGRHACRALFNMAASKAGGKAVVDAGASALIVEVLNASRAHASTLIGEDEINLFKTEDICVVENAICVFCNTSTIEVGRQAAIDEGAVAVLVRELSRLPFDEDTMVYAQAADFCCIALHNISFDAVGQQAVLDAGAVEAIVDHIWRRGNCIRLHPLPSPSRYVIERLNQVAATIVSALGVFESVSDFPAGMQRVIDLDVFNYIVQTMRGFESAANVWRGFSFVNGSLVKTDSRPPLTWLQGSERLLAENARSVAGATCRALCIMCIDEEGLEAAVKAGSPEILVKALQTYADDEEVATDVVQALYNTAFHEDAIETIAKSAPQALVSVMFAHPDRVAILGHCMNAISQLAQNSSAIFSAYADLAVITAMKKNQHDLAIAIAGGQALSDLMDDARTPRIVDNGGLLVMHTAMLAFPNSAELAVAFSMFIGNASVSPEGFRAILAEKSTNLLVTVLRDHLSSADIAHYGCRAICNIADEDDGAEAAVSANAAEVVVEAIRRHHNNAKVAESGISALNAIAYNLSAGKASVISAGGPDAIVAALLAPYSPPAADSESESDSEVDVALIACTALAALCETPAGCDAVTAAGACAAIVSAMRAENVRNADESDMISRFKVRDFACYALALLLQTDASVQAAILAGAHEAIAATMLDFTACKLENADNDDEDALLEIDISTNGPRALFLMLRSCAAQGKLDLVVKLHELGADIRDDDDVAVRRASRNGHQSVVDFLVAKGAVLVEEQRLVLDGLPPDELQTRLSSCLACWLQERSDLNHQVCTRAEPPHNAPHECFCGEEDRTDWIGFRCGHLCHLKCIQIWAAKETHESREADNVGESPPIVCPFGRCRDIVLRAPVSRPLAAGQSIVVSPNPSLGGGPSLGGSGEAAGSIDVGAVSPTLAPPAPPP